jgi:predicted nucleic acid-binding protein
MKDRLFIDTDIILDIALAREPHYAFSARVLSLIESRTAEGITSALIIANLYYLLRKIESHQAAIAFIGKLRYILRIVPVDDEIIRLSLQSKYGNFEDAIQYYAALRNRADYLITRNTKDYRKPALKVHTPGEFLAIKGG